jgi:hypothetical protein
MGMPSSSKGSSSVNDDTDFVASSDLNNNNNHYDGMITKQRSRPMTSTTTSSSTLTTTRLGRSIALPSRYSYGDIFFWMKSSYTTASDKARGGNGRYNNKDNSNNHKSVGSSSSKSYVVHVSKDVIQSTREDGLRQDDVGVRSNPSAVTAAMTFRLYDDDDDDQQDDSNVVSSDKPPPSSMLSVNVQVKNVDGSIMSWNAYCGDPSSNVDAVVAICHVPNNDISVETTSCTSSSNNNNDNNKFRMAVHQKQDDEYNNSSTIDDIHTIGTVTPTALVMILYGKSETDNKDEDGYWMIRASCPRITSSTSLLRRRSQ